MTKQNYCFFSDIQIESFKKNKSPVIIISEIPKSPAIFLGGTIIMVELSITYIL